MVENKKATVLIVDDEKEIISLIRTYLEPEGYRVLAAIGGREAIQLASSPGAPIDVLVTDVLMPFLNGCELANRISVLQQNIKVLFISGYPLGVLTSHGLCPTGSDLLVKPFSKKDLLSKMSGILVHSSSWKALTQKQ